ncbi:MULTISPECIES: S8 family peptidase [Brevibacterium]|uniref:S8 family peptidase n=1 Tax=Brevibacterium ammoniilyticum TaxID=1046555 RepID=A0ABP9U5K9_9MICO|nr:S8 family peptidase [Brevibacterium casei]
MAEPGRDLDHLYVHGHAQTQGFRPPQGGSSKRRKVDRHGHGQGLKNAAESAFEDSDEERSEHDLSDDELRATGTVIVLEGESAAYPLKLDSLSSYTRGRPHQPKWLLFSVREATEDRPERATVWVADDHRQEFLQLFQDYLDEDTPKGSPKYQDLVANIARIRRAVLADLWTSDGAPPQHGTHWWELWLDAGSEHLATFDGFVTANRLRAATRSLQLRDRVIVWVQASWSQLEILPFTAVPLTEIRRPEFIDTVEDLDVGEQQDYVTDLADRIVPAPADAPAVCHLDTGVLRTHVLLRDSLAEDDHHTVIGVSGTDVHRHGHGTSMAGLALYGDLEPHLVGSHPIVLRHRLESVRMTPGIGEERLDPIDYGSATVQAAALPEIANGRPRVYCLTLSYPPEHTGQPTLWSAAVDALAVGTDSTHDGDQFQLIGEPDPDSARLIVVAAGNVSPYLDDHRLNSETSPIEDPGQAWNALTVGAYTDLADTPQHPQYAGWSPLAEPGELSPHSRTSLLFDQRRWPIKPDICMEGGNVLSNGAGDFNERHSLLSLRSTGNTSDTALTSANATSAATAQASRLATLAMGRYPDYWPETIRGLLTHSAEWTPAMARQVKAKIGKNERHQLLRQYGWGVPTEDTVLNSSRQAVTLISQDQFVPFHGTSRAMRHFRLHSLPWPAEVLEELGSTDVRLRMTLSYFIEPSAARRGWRNRYAYASHGLRFDLQGPLESQTDFIARINREAQDAEDGSAPGKNSSDRWLVGTQARNLGSLHQDEWHGTGAELARCNSVAVFPVGGWWKYNTRAGRSDLPVRYALLLSLQTAEQNVDLYTPIATQLHVPIATTVPAT